MGRKAYTGQSMSSSGPYSHGIDAGEFIYFSGQTGYNGADYDGEKYDIHTQTTKSFHYLKDALSQANATLDDVVKVNVYLTGMKYFEEMNAVYQTMFNEPFPARTCVAVYELPLGADVEIECIVKKPQSVG